MTTKKIGIPISKLGENSVGLTLSYLEFAAQFGEVHLLLPDSHIRKDLDMILLTGGADIDTARYNERPSYFTGKPDIYKEYFDVNILPEYIGMGIPVVGLCRGEQSLAVHFNCKLIQHMSHETNKPEDPYKCVHKVDLDILSFYNWREYSNVAVLEVNSRHHQAVLEDSMPEELTVIGRHPDGTVEMFVHNSLPIIALQFHPEDIYDQKTNEFVYRMIDKIITTKQSILM